MILVKLSQIPSYLQDSELYRSFDHEDSDDLDECILVPDDCFKLDTVVDSLVSLTSILSTIRYWGVQKLPATLIDYLLNSRDEILSALEPFDEDLKLLGITKELRSEQNAANRTLIAIRGNQSDFLQYLLMKGDGSAIKSFLAAAEYGYVNCMIAARGCCVKVSSAILQRACTVRCSHGHHHCLKYAVELGALPSKSDLETAIRNGHVNCLMLLHSTGLPLCVDDAFIAAQEDQPACLEYILTCFAERPQAICDAAATNGHLRCLQQAHSMGCALCTTTLARAAQGGHIDCMQYTVAQGVAIDESVSEAACEGGSLQCLQYALELGCPLTAQCTINAASNGHLTCLEYLHHTASAETALWTVATTAAAAGRGTLPCLKFLHEHGCPFDHTAFLQAAEHKRKDSLAYLSDRNSGLLRISRSFTNDPELMKELVLALHSHWLRSLAAANAL